MDSFTTTCLRNTYGTLDVHRCDAAPMPRWRPGTDHMAPCRGDVLRWLFWSSPVARGGESVELLHKALRVVQAGVPHPRWPQLFWTDAQRAEWTTNRYNEAVRQALAHGRSDVYLLRACGWCGEPTGNWCDGFNDGWASDAATHASTLADNPETQLRRGQGHWSCRRPVCTACDAALGGCEVCCWWIGFKRVPPQDGRKANTPKAPEDQGASTVAASTPQAPQDQGASTVAANSPTAPEDQEPSAAALAAPWVEPRMRMALQQARIMEEVGSSAADRRPRQAEQEP